MVGLIEISLSEQLGFFPNLIFLLIVFLVNLVIIKWSAQIAYGKKVTLGGAFLQAVMIFVLAVLVIVIINFLVGLYFGLAA